MPLFMDRHEVPAVTAEQVAQAHLADLEMEAKFGVQFLAYWFDADRVWLADTIRSSLALASCICPLC